MFRGLSAGCKKHQETKDLVIFGHSHGMSWLMMLMWFWGYHLFGILIIPGFKRRGSHALQYSFTLGVRSENSLHLAVSILKWSNFGCFWGTTILGPIYSWVILWWLATNWDALPSGLGFKKHGAAPFGLGNVQKTKAWSPIHDPIAIALLCKEARRQGQKNFLRQVPSESAQIIWEVQQLRAEIRGWSAWVEVSAQQAAKKWNFPSPSCTLLLITGWKSCANSQSCNKNTRNEPFSPKKSCSTLSDPFANCKAVISYSYHNIPKPSQMSFRILHWEIAMTFHEEWIMASGRWMVSAMF